tara:strand:- start:65635 stop:65802 length:168 start_codon:yes stop_codon:yes gene_type:complete
MEKGTGIAIGVALGAATGNMGIWLALGIGLGVAIENGDIDMPGWKSSCNKKHESQ